jgi:hypothetical protein
VLSLAVLGLACLAFSHISDDLADNDVDKDTAERVTSIASGNVKPVPVDEFHPTIAQSDILVEIPLTRIPCQWKVWHLKMHRHA